MPFSQSQNTHSQCWHREELTLESPDAQRDWIIDNFSTPGSTTMDGLIDNLTRLKFLREKGFPQEDVQTEAGSGVGDGGGGQLSRADTGLSADTGYPRPFIVTAAQAPVIENNIFCAMEELFMEELDLINQSQCPTHGSACSKTIEGSSNLTLAASTQDRDDDEQTVP